MFLRKEPEEIIGDKIAVPAEEKNMAKSEVIKLKTEDGVEIVGDFFEVSKPNEIGVLMLHMMPAVRKSFAVFAEKIQQAG